jgi:hypothetical protein
VAAASDANEPVGEAPFAGTVSEASYTPDAAVTGANTETRTISLINRGQDGTGTTVVATLALTSGVNLVSGDEKQLTLSAVAGATTVASGDVLAFKSTHSGSTGLADPGGLVQASITRS